MMMLINETEEICRFVLFTASYRNDFGGAASFGQFSTDHLDVFEVIKSIKASKPGCF
jgi:hypothetical protein